jgi:hypothetical protein
VGPHLLSLLKSLLQSQTMQWHEAPLSPSWCSGLRENSARRPLPETLRQRM